MEHELEASSQFVERDNSSLERKLADSPIAIVGMSALFPKATNLRQYWSNIVDGVDCIEEIPESHWRVDDYYDPDPAAEDKTYCRRGGFLPEIDFNPVEFRIPPNTIEVTDVLQLLSLVVARNLLQDAGCGTSPHYDARKTGVILGLIGPSSLSQGLSARLQYPVVKRVVMSCGLSERDADEIAAKLNKAYVPWAENSFPGMLGNVVAGRIANRFDLGATNYAVDAGCAGSLAAVRMAISELLEGRADMMLTGGCDTDTTILMYMCFSKTPAFSKSGVVRPFDEQADGTLIGQGLGMLALKRLADAERHNDRIYAVIRGLGSSSDGRFTSIYAPRREGQMLALQRAYDDARRSPESIGLVEAHGTGTAVGDHVELSALADVYRESTSNRQFAAIGSVKSQIGHTKAAAGAAGLIKLALALYHKVLPPTLNVSKPNPEARFAETAFYVNTETRPWLQRADGSPRRAAISSFGFGGTNFHMVLEEHPRGSASRILQNGARAFVFSAENARALRERLLGADSGFADVLPNMPIPASHARLGFVAGTEQEYRDLLRAAIEQLDSAGASQEFVHPRGIYYRNQALATIRPVAMFAGQGSQYVNMGRAAAVSIPEVREAFDRMNRLFADAEPLSDIVFPRPSFDNTQKKQSEAALRRTDYAQPALAALSAGQYTFARSIGFVPEAALGHSFGELSALWAAGCLSDADYFQLARVRGRAMVAPHHSQSSDTGSMAAVAAPASALGDLLARFPELHICNYNSPSQTVIGGPTAAVQAFTDACGIGGLRASTLSVSVAFHTPLVAHAVEPLRQALLSIDFCKPNIPVTSNTEGRLYGEDAAANRQLLANQLLNPVCFEQQVRALHTAGHRVFVEFGPGTVLSRLVKQILHDRDHSCVSFDAGPGNVSDKAIKQACVHLKVLGVAIGDINNNLDVSVDAAEPVSAASIRLSGVNYVSPARRNAFEDMLANGYKVTPAAPAQTGIGGPPVGRAKPIACDLAVSGPITLPSTDLREDEVTMSLEKDLINVHLHFMESQLHISKQLARALETGVAADTVRHVANHAIELGRVHTRANEIFSYMLKPSEYPPNTLRPAEGSGHQAGPVPNSERVNALAGASVMAPAMQLATSRLSVPVNVASVVIDTISQATGYPSATLNPEMDLEANLGIDSLKRLEIMARLEGAFARRPKFVACAVAEIRTIADIIALLEGNAASQAPVSVTQGTAASR